MDEGLCSNAFLDKRLLSPRLRILERHYLTVEDVEALQLGKVVCAPQVTRPFFWQLVRRYQLPVWDGLNDAAMCVALVMDPADLKIHRAIVYDGARVRRILLEQLDGPFRSLASFGRQVDRTFGDLAAVDFGPSTPIFFEYQNPD